MDELELTSAERKIRKVWIWTTGFYCFILPLLLCVILTFFLLSDPKFLDEGSRALANQITTLLLSWIHFLLCYYCAYKKPGTLYLTLNLYLGALVFGLGLLLTSGLFPSFLIHLPWFFLTYRVRTINCKIQHQLHLRSPRYQELLQLFRGADTLEELNHKFISVQTAGYVDAFLNAAYKTRKSEIKN